MTCCRIKFYTIKLAALYYEIQFLKICIEAISWFMCSYFLPKSAGISPHSSVFHLMMRLV